MYRSSCHFHKIFMRKTKMWWKIAIIPKNYVTSILPKTNTNCGYRKFDFLKTSYVKYPRGCSEGQQSPHLREVFCEGLFLVLNLKDNICLRAWHPHRTYTMMLCSFFLQVQRNIIELRDDRSRTNLPGLWISIQVWWRHGLHVAYWLGGELVGGVWIHPRLCKVVLEDEVGWFGIFFFFVRECIN